MSAPFAHMFRNAGPQQREVLRSMLDHYLGEFRRIPIMFQREGVAAGLHKATDDAVKHMRRTDEKAKRVACKAGCSGCCHIEVEITRDEAKLLKMHADEQGLTIDRERLRVQHEHRNRYEALSLAQRRCVFLGEDGRCTVYAVRPMACRKYHVLDSAELCDTEKHYGASVPMLICVEAEAIHAAAFIAFRAGGMAELLLEVTE